MEGSKQRSATKRNGQIRKTAVDLSPDIISEILSRLPIESILRCRSVCKTWYGLTKDPHFINLHSSRANNQPPRLILQQDPWGNTKSLNSLLVLDTEEHKTRQIPIKTRQLRDLQIMCSCNGLLCMASESRLEPVLIYNPITTECLILPATEPKQISVSHLVGLGFDTSTGKYKVVRKYSDIYRSFIMKFEIITLGESSWRELASPHSSPSFYSGPVVWNGCLHWKIGKDGFNSVLNSGRECILTFDISDEKFQIISLPDYVKVKPLAVNLELLDLGGFLNLVEHDNNLMKIWKVTGNKEEGFSICHQHTYDTHVHWGSFVRYKMISRPNQHNYLMQVCNYRSSSSGSSKDKKHLVRYFPQMVQYLHLDIPGIPDCFDAFCFKPSLVSPIAAALLGF